MKSLSVKIVAQSTVVPFTKACHTNNPKGSPFCGKEEYI